MLRRPLTLLTAASTVVLVAAVAAAGWGLFRDGRFAAGSPGVWEVSVESAGVGTRVGAGRRGRRGQSVVLMPARPPAGRWSPPKTQVAPAYGADDLLFRLLSNAGPEQERLGIRWADRWVADGPADRVNRRYPVAAYRVVSLPLAYPAAAAALLPAAWLARRRRAARRQRSGLCPGCGYDLRAAAGRCPECGVALRAR